MCSTSLADLKSEIDAYNDSAYACGAPELDAKSAIESTTNKDSFLIQCSKCRVIIQMTSEGVIKTVGVYADDDSSAADYLCCCMAWVTCLGETSIPAYGMLLTQFSSIRAGFESVPYVIGTDAFQIISDDSAKYTFVYMNNDLSSGH